MSASVGRMKTSGILGDIDIKDLKKYRRLNGYALFVLVNRKRYGDAASSTDDFAETSDAPGGTQRDCPKNSSRRWRAMWSTLPERVRKEWRARAQRLLKQDLQLPKRDDTSNRERRLQEIRRLENQLAKCPSVNSSLLDFAALFQILSDSLQTLHKQSEEDVASGASGQDMEPLLDSLLSAFFPLLGLLSEVDGFADAVDKEMLSRGLQRLTYISPLKD